MQQVECSSFQVNYVKLDDCQSDYPSNHIRNSMRNYYQYSDMLIYIYSTGAKAWQLMSYARLCMEVNKMPGITKTEVPTKFSIRILREIYNLRSHPAVGSCLWCHPFSFHLDTSNSKVSNLNGFVCCNQKVI